MQVKRYVTVVTFARRSGMTVQEVMSAVKGGTLEVIKAKGGYWKVALPADIPRKAVEA